MQPVRTSYLRCCDVAEESLELGGLRLREGPVDPVGELPGVKRGATVLAPLGLRNLSARDSRREGNGLLTLVASPGLKAGTRLLLLKRVPKSCRRS